MGVNLLPDGELAPHLLGFVAKRVSWDEPESLRMVRKEVSPNQNG